jgi:hypothetical protein
LSQTDLLLITPPFVQVNTPYPATASLKGFLQEHGFCVLQFDLGIACILEMLSKDGLNNLFYFAKNIPCSPNARKIIQSKNAYIQHIDAVIAFLQGKDTTFAYAINNRILPEAERFNIQQDLEWHFGTDGIQDKAKLLATLFLEDIGDFITECIDKRFGFSRYAEQIGVNAISYQTILEELKINTPITEIMWQKLDKTIKKQIPKLIGFTIPFPGNFLMALKSAEFIKKNYPNIPVILGGGFVNTELRLLNEPRLFELVNYICLDDGELPLLKLLNHINRGTGDLARTFMLEEGKVKYMNNTDEKDIAHKNCGTPDFDGLPLTDYISVSETTNPMHNLWSNGRWNKMVLAHGCYWHRCSFCDITLDYIKRYSCAEASILCNRIESIIKQTRQHGFHFTDEAASPVVLKNLAEEIIRRNISISWWTNIRFETAFTPELCNLLATSGCVAVSGGMEVACDRLLEKMEKGVNVEQVIKVCAAFQQAGIMIHAYLMYGFPTQTAQETIDSLEIVRQLFHHKLLKSAFWHRFAMTVHSPIGINPEIYGVERISNPENVFAQNGCNHIDKTACDHEKYGDGLIKALYNYIHDNGIEYDLQDWFNFKIPATIIPPNYIKRVLKKSTKFD